MPKICQSCAMPMNDESVFGTNKDVSKNSYYCVYCYKNGEFVDKVSMEEYIEKMIPFSDQAGMTPEQMRQFCENVYPALKRWKK